MKTNINSHVLKIKKILLLLMRTTLNKFPVSISIRLNSFKMLYFGEFESNILKYIVRPDFVAIDVGANHGAYTYLLSKLCSKVICFEPNKDLAKKLNMTRLKNVVVHNIGLSSKRENCYLYYEEIHGMMETGTASLNPTTGSKLNKMKIEVAPLDDFQFERIDIIKIDVEGHEIHLLAGASSTINKHRPIILIEIEQRYIIQDIDNVFNEILRHGYQGYFFNRKKLYNIREFDLIKHQNIAFAKRYEYSNNFIFFPV